MILLAFSCFSFDGATVGERGGVPSTSSGILQDSVGFFVISSEHGYSLRI